MKILYFAHSVLNRGGDKMVLAHLAHLATSGHQVVIRSNLVETVFPLHPRIELQQPFLPGKVGSLLSALFERQRCDLVIATIVPTALLLALRNRGRVLYFAQDDNETAYRAPVRHLIRFMSFLLFSVLALPTVAVSHGLAATFRSRFGADCRVVENGIDTEAFFPSPSAELLAVKGERKAILLLSRKDGRKGFDLALKAVSLLTDGTKERIELWTVGDQVQLTEAGVRHRHFGVVDEAGMRSLMSSADVFLFPSRSEGFGLMVLEAFACSCAVVTTEAVGYARHGETALVSKVGDFRALATSLRQALEDAGQVAAMTARARSYAREHALAGASSRFEEEVLSFYGGKTGA